MSLEYCDAIARGHVPLYERLVGTSGDYIIVFHNDAINIIGVPLNHVLYK